MKKTEFITGLMVAMAIMISLLLLAGAISPKTDNYHKNMEMLPENGAINIACSENGGLSILPMAQESYVQKTMVRIGKLS